MPTFGTHLTTVGEILPKIVDKIKSIPSVPATWVFIGDSEQNDEFVQKTNETVVVINYPSTNADIAQQGGGNATQLRVASLIVTVYKKSEIDAARERTQALNNPITGFNEIAEDIYFGVSMWYPEKVLGEALTIEPIHCKFFKKADRQISGYSKIELGFEFKFFSGG